MISPRCGNQIGTDNTNGVILIPKGAKKISRIIASTKKIVQIHYIRQLFNFLAPRKKVVSNLVVFVTMQLHVSHVSTEWLTDYPVKKQKREFYKLKSPLSDKWHSIKNQGQGHAGLQQQTTTCSSYFISPDKLGILKCRLIEKNYVSRMRSWTCLT